MVCSRHYSGVVNNESDLKEDAHENHSKYPSSDMQNLENWNEEDSKHCEKKEIFKIEKLKQDEENKISVNININELGGDKI